MNRFRMVAVMAGAVMAMVPLGSFVGAVELDRTPAQVPCSDPRGCPDLLVDGSTMAPNTHVKNFKPQDCQVQEGTTTPGTRRVLRFTFTTPNLGDGDLIVGRPEDNLEWFEWGECHGHYHFKEYADYRLWTPAQFDEYKAFRDANPDMLAADILAANPQLQPVVGEKRGFCVIDIWPYLEKPGPPKYVLCDLQGISLGWADEYGDFLDSQFIDITGVAPGQYVLEAEVNAEHVFQETSYRNNWTAIAVTI